MRGNSPELEVAASWQASCLEQSASRLSMEAEDLAVELFLRMMTAIQSGRDSAGDVPAYLRTTVRRLSTDVSVKVDNSVPIGIDLYGLAQCVQRASAENSSKEALLEQAFRSLPPRWRQVLWMVEVLGYSPGEVAAALDMAVDATYSLLWRARKAWKARIDNLLERDSVAQ